MKEKMSKILHLIILPAVRLMQLKTVTVSVQICCSFIKLITHTEWGLLWRTVQENLVLFKEEEV